jgi:RNA polymerase sigma-70 factor (ECF subfamily)
MSLTLADVLYASFKAPVPEGDWARLVRCVAASDQSALHTLYERSHRIVFTLIMRITANRETAEEITLDVFHDIWRRARDYDPANFTVLGWIMNLARARATGCLPYEGDLLKFSEQREALRKALATLAPDERLAIETTFFAGLPHAQAAARIDQPLGTVIRSGLHKLRHAVRGEPMTAPDEIGCGWSEVTCAYTVHALPADEVETVIAHITSCPICHREMEGLRPLIDSFACWPTDILRPRASVQARLARRIADGLHDWLSLPRWPEPETAMVAPGIECTLLAADKQRERVSMLVRFAPGAQYAAHTHAGSEECHLLDGTLRIDERDLLPGDYHYSEPGSRHTYNYSRTGCTCFLVTSTGDTLD